MLPSRRAAAAAAAVLVVAGAPAGAAPDASGVIRPGVGIGKVKLGMTPAAVRRALGTPGVVWQREAGFARQRVEWQYAVRGYTVTFTGRAGGQRVSAVGTVGARDRTPQGVGVGTLERRLQRVYGSRLRCARLELQQVSPQLTAVVPNRRSCTLPSTGGAETVFVSSVPPVNAYDAFVRPSRWPREARIFEVVVRRPAFSFEY